MALSEYSSTIGLDDNMNLLQPSTSSRSSSRSNSSWTSQAHHNITTTNNAGNNNNGEGQGMMRTICSGMLDNNNKNNKANANTIGELPEEELPQQVALLGKTTGNNNHHNNRNHNNHSSSRKGRCNRCGIKTHTVSIFAIKPMTTSDVYNGRCIRCSNPVLIPYGIRKEWEIQNAALLVQDEAVTVCTSSSCASSSSQQQPVRGYSGVEGAAVRGAFADLDEIEERVDRTNDRAERETNGAVPAAETTTTTTAAAAAKQTTSNNKCRGCGIRTHKNILGKRFPVTTATVFEGHCIKCSPQAVPLGILQKWQIREGLGFGGGAHQFLLQDRSFELDSSMESSPAYAGVVQPFNNNSNNNNNTSSSFVEPSSSSSTVDMTTQSTGCSGLQDQPVVLSDDDLLLLLKKDYEDEEKEKEASSGGGGGGALPLSSRVGVPIARVVPSEQMTTSSTNDDDNQVLHVDHVALPDNEVALSAGPAEESSNRSMGDVDDNSNNVVVYASQVEPLRVRKGYCECCGEIKTHRTTTFPGVRRRSIPITNNEVYKGNCLNCHPEMRPISSSTSSFPTTTTTTSSSSSRRRSSLKKMTSFSQRLLLHRQNHQYQHVVADINDDNRVFLPETLQANSEIV